MYTATDIITATIAVPIVVVRVAVVVGESPGAADGGSAGGGVAGAEVGGVSVAVGTGGGDVGIVRLCVVCLAGALGDDTSGPGVLHGHPCDSGQQKMYSPC